MTGPAPRPIPVPASIFVSTLTLLVPVTGARAGGPSVSREFGRDVIDRRDEAPICMPPTCRLYIDAARPPAAASCVADRVKMGSAASVADCDEMGTNFNVAELDSSRSFTIRP